MKIILKSYDEPEIPSDVLPSIVSWAQRDNNKHAVAARFEMASGIYEAFKTTTKTGTKVVDVVTERRYVLEEGE